MGTKGTADVRFEFDFWLAVLNFADLQTTKLTELWLKLFVLNSFPRK